MCVSMRPIFHSAESNLLSQLLPAFVSLIQPAQRFRGRILARLSPIRSKAHQSGPLSPIRMTSHTVSPVWMADCATLGLARPKSPQLSLVAHLLPLSPFLLLLRPSLLHRTRPFLLDF
ncbi:hypothetical protein CRG98_044763 [Punica granatum]|uniref:Uncharacterized protein n=1 Tax=Punica granatum TaxID=22663 RepID=A0A2I0HUB3_PUNGR|nr:hypothetical protein CRG98_044763 [Punica granatum]